MKYAENIWIKKKKKRLGINVLPDVIMIKLLSHNSLTTKVWLTGFVCGYVVNS